MEQALVILCIFIIAFFLLAAIMKLIIAISRDLKYINTEISRTKGSEQRPWKRRKRRLYSKFWVYFMN